MAIIAENQSNGGFSKEPVEQGVHVANCYSMVHIGTVDELVMGETKVQNKVRITWEFPYLLKVFKPENGEQPMVISKEFTLSMHEKSNLRKVLESWRGKKFTDDEAKSFDITKLLGKSCQINVGHKTSKDGSKTYAEILGIMPLSKGTPAPQLINTILEVNYDTLTFEILGSLPQFLTDKMKTSREYEKWLIKQSESNVSSADLANTIPNDDDPPF